VSARGEWREVRPGVVRFVGGCEACGDPFEGLSGNRRFCQACRVLTPPARLERVRGLLSAGVFARRGSWPLWAARLAAEEAAA
jgi:hypothetical protein